MGLRASGKTTLGPMLGDRIGAAFVDLDDHSALRLGSPSAAAAIRDHGMDKFRLSESQALETALATRRVKPLVLALGGGTPTFPASHERLLAARSAGCALIYLHASPGVLRSRLGKTDVSSRPSLTGEGVLAEVETVYLQRDPIYRALATATIDAEGSPDATLGRLVDALKPRG
jgi:shikimate kinase